MLSLAEEPAGLLSPAVIWPYQFGQHHVDGPPCLVRAGMLPGFAALQRLSFGVNRRECQTGGTVLSSDISASSVSGKMIRYNARNIRRIALLNPDLVPSIHD